VRDDRSLFELLCLEGAMAGLSWLTILKKRRGYREEFFGFHIDRIIKMTVSDIQEILNRGRVVKHFGKVKSVITNAHAVQKLLMEHRSLHAYFACMLGDTNVHDLEITTSPVSQVAITISKDLKRRGFVFVGPTTIQSFLQAAGLFQCHDTKCFRYIPGTGRINAYIGLCCVKQYISSI
jgi:DNA-3-methyladenine glycosylase I